MSIVILRRSTGSVPSVAAPAWFSSLSERVWTDIAGGSAYSGANWQKGNRLTDVAPSPTPPGAEGQIGIIRAWNGAVSLQSRGEYLKVAEGGHNSYYGNEIYALRLKDEVPGWKRIWGPTPNASISTSNFNRNDPFITNLDSTPRTAHGWFNRQASQSDERLWTLRTAASPNGEWSSDSWSIPRSSLGEGVTDANLWVYHGRLWTSLPASLSLQSGPTGYDMTAHQIMVAADFATADGVRRIDIDAAVAAGSQNSSGPAIPGMTEYAVALGGNPLSNGWSVITLNTSPRCWIIGSPNENVLYVWNLESPNGFRTKTTSGGSVSGTASAGAAYFSASRKLILGGINIGTTLRTLAIPTDPWNASSGFDWGTIAPAGGTLSAAAQFNGTFSQFQMIEDMGDGRACIVMHTRDVDQPTYVYKLPETI